MRDNYIKECLITTDYGFKKEPKKEDTFYVNPPSKSNIMPRNEPIIANDEFPVATSPFGVSALCKKQRDYNSPKVPPEHGKELNSKFASFKHFSYTASYSNNNVLEEVTIITETKKLTFYGLKELHEFMEILKVTEKEIDV